MKNKIIVMVVVFLTLFQVNVSANSTNNANTVKEIDLIDVMNHPQKYEDVEVVKHDSLEDFIEVILSDGWMNQDEKLMLIDSIRTTNTVRAGETYGYLTFTFTSTITTAYKVKPYFYSKVKYCGMSNPCEISKIEYANLDRNYNGTSKQFKGSLYYNLENYKTIFFDLNGDFYNNGTTTSSGGGSVNIGEQATMSFSIAYSSDHFAYKKDTQRFIFDGIA